MNQNVFTDIRPFLTAVVLSLSCFLPLMVVGVLLHRKKRRYHAEAQEPFTSLPLRPPGESLRLRIEQLSEEFDSNVVTIALSGVLALVLTFTTPPAERGVVGIALLLFTATAAIWSGRKLFGLSRQLWDYRLGFVGERIVGEELNQLLSAGFCVFHDVPFNSYNIDHVLVGPPGVYAVETKARRKPTHIKSQDRARIVFDGEALHFATGVDRDAIQQTRRNANDLGKWLAKATGENVSAKGILTFPGWFIQKNNFSDVRVMNPEQIKHHFHNHPRQALSSQQIQRIKYQLTERCRLTGTTVS